MDSKLLENFQAVASELHFGRAAQRLGIHPSGLGRNIRLLEEELGVKLLTRTTRNVALTRSGHALLTETKELLRQIAKVKSNVRELAVGAERVLRLGAIDSASTGLVPQLLHDFHIVEPDIEIALVEDKSVNLLPKLKSGALDFAIVRPPYFSDASEFEFEFLLDEPTIVALPESHELVEKDKLTVHDLDGVPLIVPSPRGRPHSYNLTFRLFTEAGLNPNICQQAEEKQTIVNLVGANIGAALVPYWTSRMTVGGVVYRPLIDQNGNAIRELPLAAAWIKGSDDTYIQAMVTILKENLPRYAS